MARRLMATVGFTSLLAACGASAPSPEPSESMPPAPSAPAGWASVAGFGGTGGSGFVGISSIKLGGHPVALSAACAGDGSLVVIVEASGGSDAGVAPSAVFPCGGSGKVAENRFEITNMPIPDVATIQATVVEAPVATRHAVFSVSVEQRGQ